MKKTLALILAAIMALSLVACAKTPANGGTEAKGSVLPELQARGRSGLAGAGQDLHREDRRGSQGRHRRLRPI